MKRLTRLVFRLLGILCPECKNGVFKNNGMEERKGRVFWKYKCSNCGKEIEEEDWYI